MSALEILFEDNHCLAVNKPAGVTSAHFQGGEETLDQTVKEYLKRQYQKPGNVFLGIVQRIDRPVSGVMLFARTSKAASRLAAQFRAATVRKSYLALVEGRPADSQGTMRHWLRKNENLGRFEAHDSAVPNAQQAILHFRILTGQAGMTLLEIQLDTGRRHQIRAQLAAIGHPIVGDRRYQARASFGAAIALHAWKLGFEHPVRKEPIELMAPLPSIWRERFPDLVAEPGP